MRTHYVPFALCTCHPVSGNQVAKRAKINLIVHAGLLSANSKVQYDIQGNACPVNWLHFWANRPMTLPCKTSFD